MQIFRRTAELRSLTQGQEESVRAAGLVECSCERHDLGVCITCANEKFVDLSRDVCTGRRTREILEVFLLE